jgi:hypothetical protein
LHLSFVLSFYAFVLTLLVSLVLRCLDLSPMPWVGVNGQEYHSHRGVGLLKFD